MELELNDYPELLTVEEAAAYLRISRTLGYQLARQYQTTDGQEKELIQARKMQLLLIDQALDCLVI